PVRTRMPWWCGEGARKRASLPGFVIFLVLVLSIAVLVLVLDRSLRYPTVMSKPEVTRVLSFLTGIYLLIGQLFYGCGIGCAGIRYCYN
ncbi:MAG: hypothetical protein NTY15_15980, partial [Planctomycetota bacterium]|nr:hypothetical protein [Planctomycetota bacterium]